MKKIGPCKVVRKFGQNAYEIELPPGVAISHIFNVADLYPFKGSVNTGEEAGAAGVEDEEWIKDLPPSQPMKLESILDKREIKRTRHREYNKYLVKWHGLPNEDATWISEDDIKQHGVVMMSVVMMPLVTLEACL